MFLFLLESFCGAVSVEVLLCCFLWWPFPFYCILLFNCGGVFVVVGTCSGGIILIFCIFGGAFLLVFFVG